MGGSHLDIWYPFLIAFNKIRDWWFYICAGLEEVIEFVISCSCSLHSFSNSREHPQLNSGLYLMQYALLKGHYGLLPSHRGHCMD